MLCDILIFEDQAHLAEGYIIFSENIKPSAPIWRVFQGGYVVY